MRGLLVNDRVAVLKVRICGQRSHISWLYQASKDSFMTALCVTFVRAGELRFSMRNEQLVDEAKD